jgi:hypothetical protein
MPFPEAPLRGIMTVVDQQQPRRALAMKKIELNWNAVPERFQYLRNAVLDERPADLRVWQYDHQLGRHIRPYETITPEELPDLARVYEEICRRDDNVAILDWIEDAGNAPKPSVRGAACYIQGLLFLFRDLADLEVTPFSERPILAEKP